ncbi:uncharacterized protein LY89DRAFT_101110 [Mollisia scopiformis]|uniref:N-acetyltransferase domain-containing protein n=1 Tax=Mollisia scopiformis TaxID=149040 RepID=A0A194X758_MOLSC|nr:uncharacterized protein LY89DRAFT_101110 [Mollisia scopiformis]KUJ16011.1 hypothetical protein LY89DRAFT_101110 [Mollisia scopiformis]
MTFRIEPVKYEDIDILYDLYVHAHVTDPLQPFLYPSLSWAEQIQFESTGPKEVFLKHPWVHYHKIVDAETGIAAWSRWHFPRVLKDHEKEEKTDKDYFPEKIPEGANQELMQEFFDKILKVEEEYIDREKRYFINYLAVHPDYQRKGLGSMLMRIGLDAADRDGAETFLVATAKARYKASRRGRNSNLFVYD